MQLFGISIILFVFAVVYVRSFVFSNYKIKIQNKNKNRIPPLKCYLDYNENEEYPSDCKNATIDYIHKPLYIVIWEKTEKAFKLIAEMEKQGLHTVFIPEDDLDIVKITDASMPMVYKEEVLLESWMDIYAEMYPM
jgi:hypothetical protein